MNSNLEPFISLVREYTFLVETLSKETSLHGFLSRCTFLLPQIYGLGILLPDVEPENIEFSETDYPSPMALLGSILGKYDFYTETFDPTHDTDVVVGSLSDDLADIYKDLKDPLLDYESNRHNDAIWSWKFNIRGHCGDHIVNSLRAMHRLVNDQLPADYDAFAGSV